MTRARKTVGRITFVGAGPGDPGLLTVRAADALRAADLVVVDLDVPAPVTDLAGTAEIRPAVGDPAEVAKTLVAEARAGHAVARVVAGDPLSADAVVRETSAVAKTAVPFDIVPGVPAETGVPAYAGVPVGSTYAVADVRALT
ncbi:MAG: uroporphyrinogen methyltransferase / synthase, partial [Mycobacteriales bacterium]